MIHQIWRITEKKRDEVTTRLEAEALYWFHQVDSCDKELLDTWGFLVYAVHVLKSGVSSMHAQILVLAIWYVTGVNSSLLCYNLQLVK